MKKRKRYCCICDTEIEKWIITDKDIGKQKLDVCKNCSKIMWNGYCEEEKDIVKELRRVLNSDSHWKIESILFIFRKYLKIKGGLKCQS